MHGKQLFLEKRVCERATNTNRQLMYTTTNNTHPQRRGEREAEPRSGQDRQSTNFQLNSFRKVSILRAGANIIQNNEKILEKENIEKL